jgi:hypothetical protein
MRPHARKARQMISTTPIGDTYEQLGYVPAASAGSQTADIGFVVGRFRGPTFTGVELSPGPYETYAGPYLTNEAALRLAKLLIQAAGNDPDDWAPCQGHPPYATAGFVGCSDHWPPPTDDPPGDHSARPAEASAEDAAP